MSANYVFHNHKQRKMMPPCYVWALGVQEPSPNMFLILMKSMALGILSTIPANTFGAENRFGNLAVPKAVVGEENRKLAPG